MQERNYSCPTQHHSESTSILIANFSEVIKPVVLEKSESDYRHLSKILAIRYSRQLTQSFF